MGKILKSNEWEFQGEVLSWVNQELLSRKLGFERASQEFPNKQGKRSDVVVWRDHVARISALEIELKTPETELGTPSYQRDAVQKAQAVKADFVALWNMRRLELYRTPAPPRKELLTDDLIKSFETLTSIKTSNDWLLAKNKDVLKQRVRELLLAIHDLDTTGSVGGAVVDATVFVEYLTEEIRKIRFQLHKDFQAALAGDKALRAVVYNWAAKQGLADFVDDLNESLAAQLAYRLVGQTLFYYAFGRQETLPSILLQEGKPVQPQLRVYWDAVRAFDYEALFEESVLEQVPLTADSESSIVKLINQLGRYDWNKIDLDVLGSVFEQMIPEPERIVLGQYYTNPRLVDLIVSLSVSSQTDAILDPAVGTGTFLYRAHDRATRLTSAKHHDLLERMWGFDISAFAAELAVINLCRVDLSSRNNFPRVAVRDFFNIKTGITVGFAPAKRMQGGTGRVEVSVPSFDVIVGNPPYVRSQQLDDLDDAYKKRLQNLALIAGAGMTPKFDAFAYFIVHSAALLRDGGRLGFVTSAAWLTSAYGATLQKFILEQFQPIAILWSQVEPFFSAVEVDTVIVILEKLSAEKRKSARAEMRFVRVNQFLKDLVPPDDPDYWARMDQLASVLEASPEGDGDNFSVTLVDAQKELEALRNDPKGLRSWAQYLRMSDIYRDLLM